MGANQAGVRKGLTRYGLKSRISTHIRNPVNTAISRGDLQLSLGDREGGGRGDKRDNWVCSSTFSKRNRLPLQGFPLMGRND